MWSIFSEVQTNQEEFGWHFVSLPDDNGFDGWKDYQPICRERESFSQLWTRNNGTTCDSGELQRQRQRQGIDKEKGKRQRQGKKTKTREKDKDKFGSPTMRQCDTLVSSWSVLLLSKVFSVLNLDFEIYGEKLLLEQWDVWLCSLACATNRRTDCSKKLTNWTRNPQVHKSQISKSKNPQFDFRQILPKHQQIVREIHKFFILEISNNPTLVISCT